ncbi:MAG: hypothetical protein JNL47_11345 [Bacteroidia bacterium]|nr:hypothetical protein [Bacteroidia bacterium]
MCRNKYYPWMLLMLQAIFITGCHQDKIKPETLAIHNPIYPDYNTPVSFGLFFLNSQFSLSKVDLQITYRTVNKTSSETDPEQIVLNHTWHKSDTINLPVIYSHAEGFPLNAVVTYTFKVTPEKESDAYTHRVTFATKPYYPAETAETEIPLHKKQPIPVYATADVNRACNLLFVAESDLPDLLRLPGNDYLPYFYMSVREFIKNGVLLDRSTRKQFDKFNFFINPVQGKYNYTTNGNFENPQNSSEILFCDAFAYIHQQEYDREVTKLETRQFTSRIFYKGSFMHELGHALFGLGDEYEHGKYFPNNTKPNNWNNENNAREYARRINVPAKNMVLVQDADIMANRCYILCPYEGCIMGLSGISIVEYGPCCREAVNYYMEEYSMP